ncbi:hypothetical protein H9627_09795 [Corynebacterium sp. Sa1YVA5]|uniref:Transcriptional regulator, AbiEi antitoxin, Type IV TA system n=2 Tax=Corynebacterium gallinarum TaxID=2762214 RepID=A0A8I0HPS9_9CORY|nr:hypothetical protein [Corynebacterium gallinarum]
MGDNHLGAGPFHRPADLDQPNYWALRREVRGGRLIRMSTGVYVESEYWHSLSETDKEKAHAVMIARRTGAPLVGRTAALFHRFPLPSSLTDIPVEIGHRRTGSVTPVIHRHLGPDLPEHLLTIGKGQNTYRLTNPTRTCIDVARWYPMWEAVTYMDHALRTRMTSMAKLREHLDQMRGFKGIASARTAVRLTTPWSESPRESVTKVAMFHAGLPAPLQQVGIYDPRGDLLGRVDFLFEEISVAVEYDGMGKPGGEFGVSSLAATKSEFKRHSLLTQEGLLVFRLNAADFTHRDGIDRLVEQVRRASHHSRPFPQERFRAAGRAWREAP